MNLTKLLFSVVLIPLYSTSQVIEDYISYDQKSMDKFLASTTYIVLDQFTESEYSKALTKAVKEYWKITPYEIIDRGRYNELIKDKSKSFLTREHLIGSKDYISLSLFMGGQKQMDTKGKLVAVVRLKHYTETDEDFTYKLPTFIQNIQWQANMIKNQKFTGNEDFQNYYKNQGYRTLHTLNLYVLNEHLTNKVETLEKLQKYYKYNVALVNRDVIEDAITTQDSAIAFLNIVAPIKNPGGDPGYFRIYRAAGGESLLSYSRGINSTAPLGVTGYDLKLFNK